MSRTMLAVLCAAAIVFSVIAVSPAARAGDTVLIAVADTYVNEAQSGSNFGDWPYLEVANSQFWLLGQSVVLLRFDLSTVNKDARIDFAILRLYSMEHSEVTVVTVHSSADTWEEMSVSYNDMPDFSYAIGITATGLTPNTWGEWNVTATFRSALDDASRHLSLALTCSYSSQAPSMHFVSREQNNSGGEDRRPQLRITYYSGPDMSPVCIGAAVVGVITFLAAIVWTLKRWKKSEEWQSQKRVADDRPPPQNPPPP